MSAWPGIDRAVSQVREQRAVAHEDSETALSRDREGTARLTFELDRDPDLVVVQRRSARPRRAEPFGTCRRRVALRFSPEWQGVPRLSCEEG